jgi:hypothetical protein
MRANFLGMTTAVKAGLYKKAGRSVNAAAFTAVRSPFFVLAKSFVRDVEDAPQVIALALVLLLGDDFRIIVGRVDQTRNALQFLLAGIF